MVVLTHQTDIPALPGSYGLFLELKAPAKLKVGRLGNQHLPAGWYLYLGSALGPGGLRARLGRHLRGGRRAYWHIDMLRSAALPGAGFYLAHPNHLECVWLQALAGLAQATVPAAGFGSSDCRSGCPAHLLHFPLQNLPGLIAQIHSYLESYNPLQANLIVYFLAGAVAFWDYSPRLG